MELRDQDGTLLMAVGKTGGPAFPTRAYDLERQTWTREEGMTLRDYFAAKAMQGFSFIACPTTQGEPEGIATWCYQMADAMLKARTA
jgi:hypothetical protein